MKKILLLIVGSISFCFAQIDLNGALETIQSSTDKVHETLNQAAEHGNKTNDKGGTENNGNGNTETNSNQSTDQKNTNTTTETPKLKAYQNYDFVAGERIIFADDFTSDMDGEFPSHWELSSGQAVINKISDQKAFFLTDGNYAVVSPRMKTKDYLGEEFTIEFDYYNYKPQDGSAAYGIVVIMQGFRDEAGYDEDNHLQISSSSISYSGSEVSLSKDYPSDLAGDEKFSNKYHHIAIAVKNKQLKVYVDQYRILVVPDTKTSFKKVSFAGIASDDYPIIFNNVRIAEGGKMNMLDKVTTDGKIITHGILFDVNKSSIKPESMGVINQIYQLLKDNADLKFEIGGFTDSDGDDNANLKLSEQRAIAVKEQLVLLGIAADRLTTKGYGETKPIDVNTSIEGKANNRRVEFTKQ